MEFGEKSRFGISVALDSEHGGAWLFGKFCYWIGGIQIGKYEQGTSIRDVFFQSKWIDSDNKRGRVYLPFCDAPDIEVFSLIDSSLFGSNSNESSLSMAVSMAQFNVSIPVDVFDDWKVFLIECVSFSKVLFMNQSDQEIRTFTLDSGEFENIFSQFYRYMENLVDKHTGERPAR